jgi:hypothetical protein
VKIQPVWLWNLPSFALRSCRREEEEAEAFFGWASSRKKIVVREDAGEAAL